MSYGKLPYNKLLLYGNLPYLGYYITQNEIYGKLSYDINSYHLSLKLI